MKEMNDSVAWLQSNGAAQLVHISDSQGSPINFTALRVRW